MKLMYLTSFLSQLILYVRPSAACDLSSLDVLFGEKLSLRLNFSLSSNALEIVAGLTGVLFNGVLFVKGQATAAEESFLKAGAARCSGLRDQKSQSLYFQTRTYSISLGNMTTAEEIEM